MTAVSLPPGTTVAAARRLLTARFRAEGLDTPELDARILVGYALALDHAALAAAPERVIETRERTALAVFATRRLRREPVARILGVKEFWGMPFVLSPATLVPRPDTETLVAAALEIARVRAPGGEGLRIADLGTGSGAVLLALLRELPGARGVGTDISAEALATARTNANALGLADRAFFVCCDYGAALAGGFDLVVSNPPYVTRADIPALAPEVRDYDPLLALDGGEDGLCAYRAIARDGLRVVASGGVLLVELGAESAATPFTRAGWHVDPLLRRDLAGRPRVLCASWATDRE